MDKRFISRKSIGFFCLVTMTVVAIFFSGYFFGAYKTVNSSASILKNFTLVRSDSESFSYIRPLLGTQAPDSSSGLMKKQKKGINDIANKYKESGMLRNFGFFYQDLNSSLWFNIDGDAEYLPASLAKLPVALIIMKKIESGELSESRKFFVSEEMISFKRDHGSLSLPSVLEAGKYYTVKELLMFMLRDSDNIAKDLLTSLVDRKSVDSLYSTFQFDMPFYGKDISPNEYVFFFKVLYNATYLTRENSDFILSSLAESTYDKALVHNLPKNIKVSHKYGLYNLTKITPEHPELQLHDCGIVYHTRNPYIVCIMTRGSDEDSLDSFIAEVSEYLYKQVDSYNDK